MVEDYCLIPLTKGLFAKVSPGRFDELAQFKWQAMWSTSISGHYAITTGFKGVTRDKRNGIYRAWIHVDGHTMHLGSRKTPEAAYRELYVPAALKYHGEFACL